MKSQKLRPVKKREVYSKRDELRKKLKIPLVKRVKKHAQPKYVPRNHVLSYLCPGSVVLPKPIVDAVKRAIKDKPLKNLKVPQDSAANTKQACTGQMIHLHVGEVVLPPKYGKILERVMNTIVDYSQ